VPKPWEYKTVHSDADLNDLTSQGWEFVTMSSDGQGQHYLVRRIRASTPTETTQTKSGPPGRAVYKVGGDVLPPFLLHKIEATYTPEAHASHVEGTVVLYVEVTPEGFTENIRIIRSLDAGLDQKAIQAVREWRFRPGTKAGKPVTVAATVEVNFRLLD
jgi:TonB family protein